MAKYIGTVPITGTITPVDTNDKYPLVNVDHIKGGYRSVPTKADLNSIPASHLVNGMLGYVVDENKFYIYSTENGWDLTNIIANAAIDLSNYITTDAVNELITNRTNEIRTEIKTEIKTEVKTEIKTEVKDEVNSYTKLEADNKFATKDEIDTKFATKEEVVNKLATATGEINNSVTTKLQDQKNELTNLMDTKIAAIPGPDLSGYYTKEEVNTQFSNATAISASYTESTKTLTLNNVRFT